MTATKSVAPRQRPRERAFWKTTTLAACAACGAGGLLFRRWICACVSVRSFLPLHCPAEDTVSPLEAVTVSNPFEVVKIRLQMQGELRTRGAYERMYRGMIHGFYSIFKAEGIRGVHKGLFLAFPYTITMNGLRLGSYGRVKRMLAERTGFSQDNPVVGVAAGASCGIFGSFFANPFYVAKNRWQAQAPAKLGLHQHAYTGPFNALVSIGRAQGLLGYYVGFQAACWRIAAGSATQLATYDFSKRVMAWLGADRSSIRTQLGASIVSSVVLTAALNPFDVVFTRVVNQARTSSGAGATYSGNWDCWRKVFKAEGIYGFYKGSVSHFARLAPHTTLLLVFFDRMQLAANSRRWY